MCWAADQLFQYPEASRLRIPVLEIAYQSGTHADSRHGRHRPRRRGYCPRLKHMSLSRPNRIHLPICSPFPHAGPNGPDLIINPAAHRGGQCGKMSLISQWP